MKVQISSTTIEGSFYDNIQEFTPCCKELPKSEIVTLLRDDEEVKAVMSSSEEIYSHGFEYFEEPIKFCPFCGEKIEVVITETVDRTDDVADLKTRLREFDEKILKEDSKSESAKLAKDRTILSHILSEIYVENLRLPLD